MGTVLISRPFHKPDIIVQTDCEVISAQLKSFYGDHAGNSPFNTDGLVISIKKYDDSCGTYIFCCEQENENFKTDSPLYEVSRLAFYKTTFDEGVFALHAAAVEHNGGAHIFIASTTSGKTTLTAYLTAIGMGYITDDCVMLDRASMEVYPYTTPFHLRDGGVEVLKKYGICINDATLVEDRGLKRYVFTPKNCVKTLLKIAKIYFIERSESQNSITDISTSQAIQLLMKSPITPYKLSSEYIKLIARVAAIGCKSLVYSDMDFVKRIIEETE